MDEHQPDTETEDYPVVPQVRRERPCLMCGTRFISQWSGERICQKCKSRSNWREGNSV